MDQHMFIENSIRGGLSYACRRFESTSQEEELDSSQCSARPDETRVIKYYDANNLYGMVMSMNLPYGGYRWLSESELDHFNSDFIKAQTSEQDTGYFVECDLEYPSDLHWQHNDFPVACESMKITEKDLSPYMKQCLKEIYGKTRYSSTKLVSTLRDRKHYTCHYLNLKLYLLLGLKLKKVHKVLEFKQKAFVKEYIDICREQRALAISTCLKNMFKLFSNATYGKFIQNPRRYERARVVTSEYACLAETSKPLFKSFKMWNNNFALIFSQTAEVKFAQSIATGCAILELSKYHMIHSYYFEFKAKIENLRLILTDTDSFLFSCSKKSCEKFLETSNLMDFSNLDLDHKNFSKTNAGVLGKFKDEVKGQNISAVVALRSKCYSFKVNKAEKRKLKGVKKNFRDMVSFAKYKRVLETIADQQVVQYSIRSSNHKINTIKQIKSCFSSFDDKRYYLCPIHSVPYGSKYAKETTCFICKKNKK